MLIKLKPLSQVLMFWCQIQFQVVPAYIWCVESIENSYKFSNFKIPSTCAKAWECSPFASRFFMVTCFSADHNCTERLFDSFWLFPTSRWEFSPHSFCYKPDLNCFMSTAEKFLIGIQKEICKICLPVFLLYICYWYPMLKFF